MDNPYAYIPAGGWANIILGSTSCGTATFRVVPLLLVWLDIELLLFLHSPDRSYFLC